MAAEAVSSESFQAAVDALDPGKQIEVEFAIYAIEDHPDWGDDRYVAPADSPYSGYMIDFSVTGYGIVYRIVDKGAAVELWLLYPLPGLPSGRAPRPRRTGPPPLM